MNKIKEQYTDFLDQMPRRYLDKFPGVKNNPQKAAQYVRERKRKAEMSQIYHPDKLLPGMHKQK